MINRREKSGKLSTPTTPTTYIYLTNFRRIVYSSRTTSSEGRNTFNPAAQPRTKTGKLSCVICLPLLTTTSIVQETEVFP